MAKKQKRDLYSPEEFDEVDDSPSRSQLKREMHALQQLGADLAALGDKVIKEADLPSEVEKALLLIKKLTKHEARRRHMQYVGKLMRTFDTTHVSEIVEAAKTGHTIKTAEFHRLEKVREQLIDGDDGSCRNFSTPIRIRASGYANSFLVHGGKKPKVNHQRTPAPCSSFSASFLRHRKIDLRPLTRTTAELSSQNNDRKPAYTSRKRRHHGHS